MTYQIISIILGVIAVIISFIGYYFYIRSKIMSAATGAVNNSELEDKVGEEKLELAVEEICALIPSFMKPLFPCSFIREVVQAAFDKIEEYAKKQIDKKQ
ncbi:MAG: hypothetical protein J1F36_04045 [Clostridiales bacterium]|nr:hypothetical protein [Clostridiales bacterium]